MHQSYSEKKKKKKEKKNSANNMNGLVKFLQRNRTNRIYRDVREGLLWGLAHTVLEDEKTHNFPSKSWKPGKPGV